MLYSQYQPHNNPVIKASAELDKIAQGLKDRYNKPPVSPAFCRIKFSSIERSAELIQHVLGNRPR